MTISLQIQFDNNWRSLRILAIAYVIFASADAHWFVGWRLTLEAHKLGIFAEPGRAARTLHRGPGRGRGGRGVPVTPTGTVTVNSNSESAELNSADIVTA